MTHSTSGVSPIIVGLDVGDRRSRFSACGSDRKAFANGSFPTTKEALLKALRPFPGARVVLEAGSQSPWMSRVLRAEGYDVQVADPRRVQLISKDPRKSDRRDTDLLMKMGAAMPELLGNIHHRGEMAQAHLSILRARDLLVRMRTMAVQQVRGICKAFGVRLPASSTSAFPKRVVETIPDVLHAAVLPILDVIAKLTEQERAFEKALAKVAKEHYPEVQRLQQVNGVGPVISVGYVLTIEDPKRFTSSRSVGSWLGLCPRSRASGDSNPQLRMPPRRRLLNPR